MRLNILIWLINKYISQYCSDKDGMRGIGNRKLLIFMGHLLAEQFLARSCSLSFAYRKRQVQVLNFEEYAVASLISPKTLNI